MIMPIALAHENFIDTKENPSFNINDTFLECLQKLFTFEEKDLMEFDGNTCQIINNYDPTNSIFIYTNQQGTFLYTITDATPRIHKNSMIWNCTCYKMEDVAKINEILANGKTTPIIFKDRYKRNYNIDYQRQNVEVKNNFKTQQTEFVELNNYCLKLKFSNAQHIDNTLVTYEDDGSYNFFFPLSFYGSALPPSTTDPFELPTNFYKFKYNNVEYTLSDIIENYSTNLKSVELLPFQPFDDVLGGSVTLQQTGTFPIKELEITNVTGNAKVTKGGIFFPYGHTIKRSTSYKVDIKTPLTRELVNGGGVRGFISTMLGNFPITYNGFQGGQVGTNADNLNDSYLYLDSEGWHIDGLLRCDVTPHYINYFTNETSQLLIQNMTTNAQELRQMQREAENRKTQIGFNNLQGFFGSIGNALVSGNFAGVVGSVVNSITGMPFEFERANREYQLAKANYDDKIKTQEQIASMAGKQISGNIALSSITPRLNINYFVLCLEYNFTYGEVDLIDYLNHKKKFYVCQNDYDYSTNVVNEETNFTGSYNNIASIFQFILLGYADIIGLNYNLTFKLVNVPSEERYTNIDIKESLILNLPIRNKIKTLII